VARDDLEAAADRAALAALLDARGRHREARETLHGVLSTLEQVLGPQHYEVGLTLSDLGEMHMAAGRFTDADAALARAAAIFERVLGVSHPMTTACRRRREQARSGKEYGG
jgi:tetratricopeptide (TPR) repeat protein